MCTSIILFRKSHIWPVIIGTNRDENLDRKSKFPDRHWIKKYPHVIAGKDEEKNGSWIGVNDYGLVALIHNRKLDTKANNNGSSRGHIVLEVLNYSSINDALKYALNFDRFNYNNFNLLIANNKECHWIKHDINNKNLITKQLEEGLSIMTYKDLNDKNDKKINFYYHLFSSLEVPNPSINNWDIWKESLTDCDSHKLKDNNKICYIDYQNNYGTRSSSLIAIPNNKKTNEKLIFKSTNLFLCKNKYIDIVV